MRRKILLIGSSLLLTLYAATAQATIYNVDRTIGEGSVIGFIETDGTLGVLGTTHILDWAFTLTSPGLPGGYDVIDFQNETQTRIVGEAVIATATELLFKFTEPATNFLIFQGSSPDNYWCIETRSCSGEGAGEHIGLGPIESAVRSGTIVIASVPEPATLILVGGALAGLGVRRRRPRS